MNKTDSKEKDSGLALVLIMLLIAFFTKAYVLIIPASILLMLAMTIPGIFKPFAIIWFGLSNCMGKISSVIVLSALFFTIIVPVGLFRRIFNFDNFQLRLWKKGDSAFKEYNQKYEKADLENPY